MIICTICQTENDQYNTICRECGGFLQNRIPNLDLFSTMWQIIENPRKGFHSITLAEHKNYALLLYTVFGITISFIGFWYFKLGDQFETFMVLIFWATVSGILLGILLCPVMSVFHWLFSKLFGGKAKYRNSLGITSYAQIPVVLLLILIIPIKLLTFGMYLFTFNPNPLTIKPTIYIILVALDLLLAVWAFILTVIGTQVGNQMSLWKSMIVAVFLYTLFVSSMFIGGECALKYLNAMH